MFSQQIGEVLHIGFMCLERCVKDIHEINQEMGRMKSVAVVGNNNYEKHVMGEINEKTMTFLLNQEVG
jgi:hypothetical protein